MIFFNIVVGLSCFFINNFLPTDAKKWNGHTNLCYFKEMSSCYHTNIWCFFRKYFEPSGLTGPIFQVCHPVASLFFGLKLSLFCRVRIFV